MPPLSAVSFPNCLPPRNFFEILRFSRGFLSAAPQFLPRLIFCLARHFPSSVVSFFYRFFLLIRIYLGFISKPSLPLNFPVDLCFSVARGCRFFSFLPVLTVFSSAHRCLILPFLGALPVSVTFCCVDPYFPFLTPSPASACQPRKGVCPPSG